MRDFIKSLENNQLSKEQEAMLLVSFANTSISTIFFIETLSISTILFNVLQFNQPFARPIRICPLCT